MHEVRLSIDPEIASLVRVAAIGAEPVAVGPAGPDLIEAISRTCADLSRRHGGRPPAAIPELQVSRDLYKAFGIDPTRTRPSSEALLRRILQGKPFPSVSNAVDVANLCAVEFFLSLGLYDAAKVVGGVVLRRGRPGESYAGIRKDEVHVGGRPCLVDEAGAFGNPTSDSSRTAVDDATRSLWMVIFAPKSYPVRDLEDHARLARTLMEAHLAPADSDVVTQVALLPS